MKIAIKTVVNIIRYIIFVGILLFSLATFMGKSYVQTLVLLLLAITIAYWPAYFNKRWNNTISLIIRSLAILLLLVINITCFSPEPKTNNYLSEDLRKELMNIYNQKVKDWPPDTEDIYITTDYGLVHVLACGPDSCPPLIMIHAASMGAHSWAENVEPLRGHYRIYSIDNIGEGNKSQLTDVLVYPQNGKEIADFYALLGDSLGIESSPIFGASNGGFIAMNYAYYYPERVKSLALFGPMGLTQLTGRSYMMLSITIMYPFKFMRDYVAKWAIGEDVYVREKYGDWFNCILKGIMPSVAQPVPMTSEQKSKMDLPILLYLGTRDGIVGDAELAKQTASEFPDIQIEVLESSHLIAVEKAETVNKRIQQFLNIDE